jgi:RNA recognition motif-containing protein
MAVAVREPVVVARAEAPAIVNAAQAVRAVVSRNRARTATVRSRHCWVGTADPQFTKDTLMNIFVGNLSQEVTETDLAELFKQFGQVKSTEVKRDLFSGVTKGFGFVEMPGRAHSLAAIAALDGRDFKGQPLRVNEAREFPARGKRR